jgi:transposase
MRVLRLGELIVILDLHRQGLTVSAIARRMGLDRKTMRKCAHVLLPEDRDARRCVLAFVRLDVGLIE